MDRLIPRLAIGLVAVSFLAACFMSLSGDWSGFFSADSAVRMLELTTSFFPPEADPAFLRKVAFATTETLAISWIGTLLALVAGLFFALPAAGMWNPAAKGVARLLLNALRAVPEFCEGGKEFAEVSPQRHSDRQWNMLTSLRIKNVALAADLTLDLQSGYNVITGETGAGKSIVIGALSLILGERASHADSNRL